jgi:ribonuclease P protein subunit RPR2
MSKVKAPKAKGIPNKHLHARSSFLYQAATYLTLQTMPHHEATASIAQGEQADFDAAPRSQQQLSIALELGSDLQQVSRKGQLRLAVDLKRTLCKSCNTILVPGRTATHIIENPSKDGRKPWADVLVVTCGICGGKKRFPVGAAPRLKKSKRKMAPVETSTTVSEEGRLSDATPLTGTE